MDDRDGRQADAHHARALRLVRGRERTAPRRGAHGAAGERARYNVHTFADFARIKQSVQRTLNRNKA